MFAGPVDIRTMPDKLRRECTIHNCNQYYVEMMVISKTDSNFEYVSCDTTADRRKSKADLAPD